MSDLSMTLLCLVAVGPLMISLQVASQTAGIALHEDIGSIVLGVIVSVAGLSALGLSFFRWQRKDLSLLSFGAFCILYGTRLLAEAQPIRILVADVSGHGVGAALLASMLAERFADTLLQHLFTSSGKPSGGALHDDLTLIVGDILC